MEKIQLTEQQFNEILEESVKSVLSELDWRTYASAGGKAYSKALDSMYNNTYEKLMNDKDFKKRSRQANAFKKQAVLASRDKFGKGNDDNYEFYTTVGPNNKYYSNVERQDDLDTMYGKEDGKSVTRGKSVNKMVGTNPSRFFGGDKDKVSHWKEMNKEINDFNSGKTRYKSGEGWK